MLVLTRKLRQRIVIGGDIRISVVSINKGKIRLGIDAPREISIRRAELVPEDRPPRPDRGASEPKAKLAKNQEKHDTQALLATQAQMLWLCRLLNG